jgi:endo-1,4-beta-xylanase
MVTEHIQTLCKRYPQMISWDVVNETVDPKDGSIRSTVLSDAMGKEQVLDLPSTSPARPRPRPDWSTTTI